MRSWASGSLLCLVVLLLLLATPAPVFAQNPTVGSTNPNMAPQGTISLDVTINGSGYKRGAKAKWFVTGTTNPGGVTVNNTTFVSSSQLTANITVAADAVIAGFDVQVANSDGRTGVGIDAFTITVGHGANACVAQPLPAGISLLGTLTGSALTTDNGFGSVIRVRQVTLGSQTVLVAAVGSWADSPGKVEIFFLDPVTGQVLDGQMIGSATQPQPHIVVPYATVGGARDMAAGDMNNDGIPDFVVGVADGSNGSVHGVYALLSSVSGGVLSYQLYNITAPETAGNFGEGALAMGDLDGLPGDELVAGAPGGGNVNTSSFIPGKVFIFKFNGSGFTFVRRLVSPLAGSKENDGFGKRAVIDDVTGDSRNDLIVGAPWWSANKQNPSAGRFFIFPGTVDASNYLVFSTGVGGESFGARLATGNVNGGYRDLIATTGQDAGSDVDRRAHVYSGLISAGQAPSYVLRPAAGLGDHWTTGSPGVGDLNGDGLDDVLIGADQATCGGTAYLFLSNSGIPLATRVLLQPPVVESDSQAFGHRFDIAAGTRLFVVSDIGANVGGVAGSGKVYIYKVN